MKLNLSQAINVEVMDVYIASYLINLLESKKKLLCVNLPGKEYRFLTVGTVTQQGTVFERQSNPGTIHFFAVFKESLRFLVRSVEVLGA